MRALYRIFGIVFLIAGWSVPAVIAASSRDEPAKCVGSIGVGDLLGTYAVDRRTFTFSNVPPIPAPPGSVVITALNAQTSEIRRSADTRPIGWLYLDQYGARFLQLRNDASEMTYRDFALRKNPAVSTYTMLQPVALPRGYQLQRCATRSY